jgi:RNA polymerase sigma-70 factor (ECF subfamily)
MNVDEVVNTHGPRLYRLAFMYLHDSQASEDAVQDAFLKYLKYSGQVSNPGAWLNKVVRNSCLNAIRKRKQEPPVDIWDNQADDLGDTWVDNTDESLSMTEALLKLPVEYREVLVWRYYLGVEGDEMAEQLGISPGALRTRMYRAKKALALLLKEELDNELE